MLLRLLTEITLPEVVDDDITTLSVLPSPAARTPGSRGGGDGTGTEEFVEVELASWSQWMFDREIISKTTLMSVSTPVKCCGYFWYSVFLNSNMTRSDDSSVSATTTTTFDYGGFVSRSLVLKGKVLSAEVLC